VEALRASTIAADKNPIAVRREASQQSDAAVIGPTGQARLGLAANPRRLDARTNGRSLLVMIDRIGRNLFSFSGISILVGSTGIASALVTMFVETSNDVSVKWLIFVCWLSLTIFIVLLKTISDLSAVKDAVEPYEHPIKSIPEDNLLIIRKNETFLRDIIVGCYFRDGEIERLSHLGLVHLVQDKIIQIKIIRNFGIMDELPKTKSQLSSMYIRSVVPITAINMSQESDDE
jgi:hypothetical protein